MIDGPSRDSLTENVGHVVFLHFSLVRGGYGFFKEATQGCRRDGRGVLSIDRLRASAAWVEL